MKLERLFRRLTLIRRIRGLLVAALRWQIYLFQCIEVITSTDNQTDKEFFSPPTSNQAVTDGAD